MPGLYIIEKTIEHVPSIWNLFFGLTFGLGMLFTFLFWFLAMNSWDVIHNVWFPLTIISWIIMSFGSLFCYAKIPTYPAYKAVITSEINLEDFYEKYEIVDKEHDIYTIKEIKY